MQWYKISQCIRMVYECPQIPRIVHTCYPQCYPKYDTKNMGQCGKVWEGNGRKLVTLKWQKAVKNENEIQFVHID